MTSPTPSTISAPERLSVRGLPREVVARLRADAKKNYRSMEGHVRALLCAAVTKGDSPTQNESFMTQERVINNSRCE